MYSIHDYSQRDCVLPASLTLSLQWSWKYVRHITTWRTNNEIVERAHFLIFVHCRPFNWSVFLLRGILDFGLHYQSSHDELIPISLWGHRWGWEECVSMPKVTNSGVAKPCEQSLDRCRQRAMVSGVSLYHVLMNNVPNKQKWHWKFLSRQKGSIASQRVG